MMRLQKFLAAAGVTSRRKAEELIISGKVKVNGQIITKMGITVNEIKDVVECNGKIIKPQSKKIYIALHKPAGYVSSTSAEQGKTVLDLIKSPQRIYPVGRLDKDSSGLLLLTNDGEFANRLTHPRYGSEKEYFVVLDMDLRPEDTNKLKRGMTLDGKRLQSVKVLMAKNKSARLILREGVNRQVRRMLGKLGYTVIKLKRIRVGKLELGTLKEGEWKLISRDAV